MGPDLEDLRGYLKASLYVGIEGMTTREHTDFSITVRTGEVDGVMKYKDTLVRFFEENCDKYAIGVEYAGDPTDLSKQHFQCATVFKLYRRADNLKTTLVTLLKHPDWTKDNERSAVYVTKHHDITTCAGGYCRKEDPEALSKGWTREELDEAYSRWVCLKNAKEKRNISREKLVVLLRDLNGELEYHKNPIVRDKWEQSTNRTRLNTLYKLATSQGYDLQKFYTTVWQTYLVNHYDTVIRGLDAEDVLREFLRD